MSVCSKSCPVFPLKWSWKYPLRILQDHWHKELKGNNRSYPRKVLHVAFFLVTQYCWNTYLLEFLPFLPIKSSYHVLSLGFSWSYCSLYESGLLDLSALSFSISLPKEKVQFYARPPPKDDNLLHCYCYYYYCLTMPRNLVKEPSYPVSMYRGLLAIIVIGPFLQGCRL